MPSCSKFLNSLDGNDSQTHIPSTNVFAKLQIVFIQLLLAFSLGCFLNFSNSLDPKGTLDFLWLICLGLDSYAPSFRNTLALFYRQISSKTQPAKAGFSSFNSFQISDFSFITMIVFFTAVLTAHTSNTHFCMLSLSKLHEGKIWMYLHHCCIRSSYQNHN